MTRALKLADGGAIGMGFFGQWIERDLETFEMASDRLRVVEMFWSAPDAALVARARRSGEALVGWQVGSLDEALAAVDARCDFQRRSPLFDGYRLEDLPSGRPIT